jgi:hypothetical protein
MYFDYRQMQFPGFPPGQGGPGFPSFPPGGGGQGFPGFPPTQPGMGQGQGQMQAPTGPPPSFTPSQAQAQSLTTTSQGATTFAVDPGAIQRCLFRYTYIWMRGGQQFWFFPTFVGRRSIAGFRWTGFTWVYFGTDLRRIRSFQCF